MRRTARSPPNRPIATAARPISGSPRSPRRQPASGRRSSPAPALRPNAAPSPATSSCSGKPTAGPRGGKGVWPMHAAWNRDTENLYSAWIEKLFDAPLDEAPSWKAMHEVLRDRSRNVLFNYLGLREDEKGLVIQPDCADVPYFLRAYFAFKMGLPFGYSKCTRGNGGEAPICPQWWNIVNEEPPTPPPPDQMSRRLSASSPCSVRPRPAASHAAAAEAARSRAGVRLLFAHDHRQRRAFRQRPHRGGRQRHRLLSGAARREDARVPAPSMPIRTGTSSSS